MDNQIKENMTQQSSWMRGLYMVMFAIFYNVAEVVLFAVVVAQFFFRLISGQTNPRLLQLGQSIATYIYQVMRYLTFNTDDKAYPFGEWPDGEPD